MNWGRAPTTVRIRSGTPTDSALDLARIILSQAGNDLHKLAGLGVNELMRIHGVGEAKAMSIVAALELGQRRRDLNVSQRPLIVDSRSAFELLQPVLGDLPYEEFWLLLLDRGNRLINRYQVSQGGMHGTVADPKRIFKEALDPRPRGSSRWRRRVRCRRRRRRGGRRRACGGSSRCRGPRRHRRP